MLDPHTSTQTPVLCLNGFTVKRVLNRILKLFRPSGSPVIRVFPPLALVANSKANPFSGGVKYTVVGKMGPSRTVCLGNGARWAHVYYGTLNKKSQMAVVSVLMILSYL